MKLKLINNTKSTFHIEGYFFIPGETVTADLSKNDKTILDKWLKTPEMKKRIDEDLIEAKFIENSTETEEGAGEKTIGSLK